MIKCVDLGIQFKFGPTFAASNWITLPDLFVLLIKQQQKTLIETQKASLSFKNIRCLLFQRHHSNSLLRKSFNREQRSEKGRENRDCGGSRKGEDHSSVCAVSVCTFCFYWNVYFLGQFYLSKYIQRQFYNNGSLLRFLILRFLNFGIFKPHISYKESS